ncbi:hypothetical protein GGI12_002670 [Dipsacomyces acuminosporus]|nr:hypothetical protein GGI12_002670 [Dipsacomyces acuminosporus]
MTISTFDMVDSSIYDGFYFAYIGRLSEDIAARRHSYTGCKKARLEYSALSEYRLLGCIEHLPREEREVECTRIVVDNTVWDLIAFLMGIHGRGQSDQKFMRCYLDAIHAAKSTDIGKDGHLCLRLDELSEGTDIGNKNSFAEYTKFVSDVLVAIFTLSSQNLEENAQQYVKALQPVYGKLESYISADLDDKLDCLVLNGSLVRLNEGEFKLVKSKHHTQDSTRMVVQRNIADWHLYYIAISDEAGIKSLLEMLPSKKNKYEGKLLTVEDGIYHCLSYREFLSTFSLRQEENPQKNPSADVATYFDDKKFSKIWTSYKDSFTKAEYKVQRLDGKSGWLA